MTFARRLEDARHEARHLVLGIAHGLPVVRAEIDLVEPGARGRVIFDLDMLGRALVVRGRDVATAYVACLIVGYMGTSPAFPTLATGEWITEVWPPSWWAAWETDVESMRARLAALHVTELEYEEAVVMAFSFKVDGAHLAAVELVAVELLKRGTMTRLEAVEIIAPVLASHTVTEATELLEGAP